MENMNKKKKSGGGGVVIVFLAIMLISRLFAALNDADFETLRWRLRRWAIMNHIDPGLLPVMFIGLMVFLVVLIAVVKASSRRKAGRTAYSSAAGRTTNSAAGRTSAAAQRPDPRTRSFTAPEPSCIVCDHTGEDHFVRDKAQRIAQLDEWLKNGLIDREEYRVLRDRYERDL